MKQTSQSTKVADVTDENVVNEEAIKTNNGTGTCGCDSCTCGYDVIDDGKPL
jgi:hypothetical protein